MKKSNDILFEEILHFCYVQKSAFDNDIEKTEILYCWIESVAQSFLSKEKDMKYQFLEILKSYMHLLEKDNNAESVVLRKKLQSIILQIEEHLSL